MDDNERMKPVELQCTREFLGLTLDQLAKMLEVNPRTVRSWENGRYPIPQATRVKVAEIEAATAKAVEEAAGRAVVHVRRGTGEHPTGPDEGPGDRWWRHVAYRARQINPQLVIDLAGDNS